MTHIGQHKQLVQQKGQMRQEDDLVRCHASTGGKTDTWKKQKKKHKSKCSTTPTRTNKYVYLRTN